MRKPKNEWPTNENFDNFPEDLEHLANAQEVLPKFNVNKEYCLKFDIVPNIALNELIDIVRYSDINKLLRVIAYVKRFNANTRAKIHGADLTKGELQINEINDVKVDVIKHEQYSRITLKN